MLPMFLILVDMYLQSPIKVENYLAFKRKKPCREPSADNKKNHGVKRE